jgi:tetratricopeptide (TPR) repeat protein
MSRGVRQRLLTPSTLVPCVIIAAVAAMVVAANITEGRHDARRPSPAAPAVTGPGAARSPEALARRIAELQARVDAHPGELHSTVLLAEALIRQNRVSGSAGAVARAEAVIANARREAPEHYGLLQMLAQVLVSQHRFSEAIAVAEQCQRIRPDDATVYGILGDAHLELGQYDEAFAALERMMSLRPGAASYARMSYALELQGDVEQALTAMRLAADAGSGADLEGLAWTHAQVGELLLRMGRPSEAIAAFAQASQAFPGHPFAVAGYARAIARVGRRDEAIGLLRQLAATAPSPEMHAQLGDLLAQAGRDRDAAREYGLAEAAWRSDAPEPKNLARFLADRGDRTDEAVAIAEQARAARSDIFTADALAWAYFKAGRLEDARKAMAEARRTGTRDPDILRHAREIDAAGHSWLQARARRPVP